jgi:hypothetical protein
VKDNGFIINTQKIFSFRNRTGLLIVYDISVDLFNRWPIIACVKIGASLISSTSTLALCPTAGGPCERQNQSCAEASQII